MRQRGGRTVGRYGLETLSPEAGDPGAERMQVLGRLPLVHLTGTAGEPVEELHHHQTVFQMGFPHAGNLRLVLDSLLGRYRAGSLQGEGNPLSGIHRLAQRDVGGGGVQAKDVHPGLLQRFQGKMDVGIIPDLDAVGLQLLEGILRVGVRLGKSIFPNKPLGVFQRNQQIRNDHGVIFHVRPADVQHPGNIVQGRQEDGIGLLHYQPLAQPGKLGLPRAAHQVFSQRDDGRGGHGGAVFPQAAQQIRHREYNGAGHRLPQLSDRIHRLAQAVDGNARFIHSQRGNPLRDRHLLRNTHLVKDDAGSRQLLVGLDEIAGICPETGVVFRDHDVPGFPGKTGQPFHLFPPAGRILTGVGITSVNDNEIPMVFPHQGAERLYSLVKDVVHSTLFAQI